jgi:serine/threonine-protein kinase
VGVRDLPPPLEAGRTLGGRYRLVLPIARGGMAEVWEGQDEVLSRAVAVKLLQAHLAQDGVFLERFRREAVTAARLAHPGVVSTFDTGVDAGTAYIVMELVRGCTLRQLLNEQGRLPPWLAVGIARQIADVLMYAHQAALIHRDIKPANVLLTDDEWGGLRVKVTDFGIAKAGSGLGGDLTRTGIVLGTPKYLSPEQISGKEPDTRADLYSLGVVLFEMIGGAPPFVGNTDMTTALAHLNDRPPRLSSRAADVPPPLDRLVADLLAKDPQRRVPSASVLRQRLDELGMWPPGESSGNGRWAGRRHRDPTGASAGSASGPSGGPASPFPPGLPGTGNPSGRRGLPAPGALTAVLAAEGRGVVTPTPSGQAPAGPVRTPADLNSAPRGAAGPVPGVTGVPPGPVGPSSGRAERPSRRRRAGPGLVVLGLVLVGAVVAGVLLTAHHDRTPSSGGPAHLGAIGRQILAVSPFMLGGKPDDPEGLHYLFDGNPVTAWHTDQYSTAAFGNLYPGLGVSIQLSASASLHHLVVTSPTVGWAAQTYASSSSIASGQPVSAWGQPTDTKTGISGSATFNLRARKGQWVLLWLTHLSSGRPFQVTINEITVT